MSKNESELTGIIEEQYKRNIDDIYTTFSSRRDQHPAIFTSALRRTGLIEQDEQVVDLGVDMMYFSVSENNDVFGNKTMLEAFRKHKDAEGIRKHIFSLNGHKDVRWVGVPPEQSFFRSFLTSVDYIPNTGHKIYMLVARY